MGNREGPSSVAVIGPEMRLSVVIGWALVDEEPVATPRVAAGVMQQSYLGVADDPTYFPAHHLVGSCPVMHAPASMRAEEYLPTQILVSRRSDLHL